MTTNIAESLNSALNAELPSRGVPFANAVMHVSNAKRSRIEAYHAFQAGKMPRQSRKTLVRCVERFQIMRNINCTEFTRLSLEDRQNLGIRYFNFFSYLNFSFRNSG